MIGHRSKAFRLTPQRTQNGVHLRRKLPHFSDQPLERARGGWSEDPDDNARQAGRAAAQQREARADDTQAREDAADARQLNSAAEQTASFWSGVLPFRRRVEQH